MPAGAASHASPKRRRHHGSRGGCVGRGIARQAQHDCARRKPRIERLGEFIDRAGCRPSDRRRAQKTGCRARSCRVLRRRRQCAPAYWRWSFIDRLRQQCEDRRREAEEQRRSKGVARPADAGCPDSPWSLPSARDRRHDVILRWRRRKGATSSAPRAQAYWASQALKALTNPRPDRPRIRHCRRDSSSYAPAPSAAGSTSRARRASRRTEPARMKRPSCALTHCAAKPGIYGELQILRALRMAIMRIRRSDRSDDREGTLSWSMAV